MAGIASRPLVFLSFAGSDRETAIRLGQDLERADIDTFIDQQRVPPGGDFPQIINHAIERSDYCVLLWSHAAVDRPWVNAEWSAAFMREIRERRSFLFVVRLDRTPVPSLLAARRYLDAFADWAGTVKELVSTWERDWDVRRSGIHVFPAPHGAATADGQHPTITLYIRNDDLSVEHVLTVPVHSTVAELDRCVREGLALKNSVTDFGGTVGMRFFYQLKHREEPIPRQQTPEELNKTLMELKIADGATIALEVQSETFGPTGSSRGFTYREGSAPDLPPSTIRRLINLAFGHLMP